MKLSGIYLAVATLPLFAQEWTPKRIVAITEYVAFARQAAIQGDVEVRCFLDTDGSVTRAEAVRGHPLLKEQARQNALLWKFHRTSKGESNVVTLNYVYRLEVRQKDGGRTAFLVDLPNAITVIAPYAPVNP